MKQLFLHIGYPKTGTTTLQKFLTINRDHLREQGFHYAVPVGAIPENHSGISHYYNDKSVGHLPTVRDNLRPLKKDLKQATTDKIIVTYEEFVFEDPARFKKWFKGFDVRPVVYLRDIYSLFMSYKKQMAINGHRMETFSSGPLAFAGHLKQFIKVFGEDACIVRSYNDAKKTGGTIEDFCQALGIRHSDAFRPVEDANTTKSDCAVMFLYQLAYSPIRRDNFWRLLHAVLGIDLKNHDYRCTLVSEDELRLNDRRLAFIQYQAKLLKDPSWIEHSLAKREALARQAPDTDLPAEIQHEIFAQLPPDLQQLVAKASPVPVPSDTSKPFLPPVNNLGSLEKDLLIRLREGFVTANRDLCRSQELARLLNQRLRQKRIFRARAKRTCRSGVQKLTSLLRLLSLPQSGKTPSSPSQQS
ncbi:hypothetical protein H5P28_18495 [Ruficoccus amylovorans]|uniref:Sulfotransferase domain-containing protein n=1 Tax=Ruficoccus amylovorans TaxID=1804625 RepID=A0A842HIC2_9BACT|nr:hypothetical protein [Ruficoccus amylovorans]MBC2596263.1 hypothetical protein [Ruficoccus amylovorans]